MHGMQRRVTYEGIQSGRECHIDQVAVVPDRLGLGIGSVLVSEWMDAVASGLAVTVWAVEGKPSFFERWKFEKVSSPDDEIMRPIVDAEHMRSEWVPSVEDAEPPDEVHHE